MRYQIDVSTSQQGQTKNITTKKTTYISVRDIVGALAGLMGIARGLAAKKGDISLKGGGAAAALVAPIAALATALGAVDKVAMAAGIATPVAQIAARASGVWAAPGNVGDIIKIVMSTVSKVLIALAFMAFNMLINMLMNMEFKIGEVSETKSMIVAEQLENTGKKIAGAVVAAVNKAGTGENPTNTVAINDPTGISDKDVLNNALNGGIGNIDSLGDENTTIITGRDSGGNFHNFGIIVEAFNYGNGFLIAGSNANEGLWWSEDDGTTWYQSNKTDGNFMTLAFLQYWFAGNTDHKEQATPNYSFGISPQLGANLRNANFYLQLPTTFTNGTGFSTITKINNTITGDKGNFDFIVEDGRLLVKKLLQSYNNYPIHFNVYDMLNVLEIGDNLNGNILTFDTEVAESNSAFTQVVIAEDVTDERGKVWIVNYESGKIYIVDPDKNETVIYKKEYDFDTVDSNNFANNAIHNWYYTNYTFDTSNALRIINIFTIPEIRIMVNDGDYVVATDWFPGLCSAENDYVVCNDNIYQAKQDIEPPADNIDPATIIFDLSKYTFIETYEQGFESREDYNTHYMNTVAHIEPVENEILYQIDDITNMTEYKILNDKDYIIKEFYDYNNFYILMYQSYYNYHNILGQGIFYSDNGKYWTITNINQHSWNDLKTLKGESSGTINEINTVETNWVTFVFNNYIYLIDKNDNSQIYKINSFDVISPIHAVSGYDTPIEFNGSMYIFGDNTTVLKLNTNDTYYTISIPTGYWEPFIWNNKIYAIESTQESSRILTIDINDNYTIINTGLQKNWVAPIIAKNDELLYIFSSNNNQHIVLNKSNQVTVENRTGNNNGGDTPITYNNELVVFGINDYFKINYNTAFPQTITQPSIWEDSAKGYTYPIIFDNHLYVFGSGKNNYYNFDTKRLVEFPTYYCKAIEFNSYLYVFSENISDKCYKIDTLNNYTTLSLTTSGLWTPYIFDNQLYLFDSDTGKVATIDVYNDVLIKNLDFVYDYPVEFNGYLYVISSNEHNKIIKLTEDSVGEMKRVIGVNASDAGIVYCDEREHNFYQTNVSFGSFQEIFVNNIQPVDGLVIGNISYDTRNTGKDWNVLNGFNFLCMIDFDGRLIAGSGDNTGLWYSDDRGLTWVQSDKQDGNWGSLMKYNNLICAGSADNQGIMYSESRGETYLQTNVENGKYSSFSQGDVEE
jgi:hypothetical protein